METHREMLTGTSGLQFIQENADSIFNGHSDYPDYSSSLGMMDKTMAFGKRKPGDKDCCGEDDSDDEVTPTNVPPRKKTKGRVKIKMEYIENKLRRYTTFSKRKTGIMKKAYELSTLTGTQVMLLVASETGHVYTFATRKLQPMITSESGKALIQTCLNSPDQDGQPLHINTSPSSLTTTTGDQRMNPSGFEEPELSYNVDDNEEEKMNTPIKSPSRTVNHLDTPQRSITQSSIRSTPSPLTSQIKSVTPNNTNPTDILLSQNKLSTVSSTSTMTNHQVMCFPATSTTSSVKPVTMIPSNIQAMLPAGLSVGTPFTIGNAFTTQPNAVYKLPSGAMVFSAGGNSTTKNAPEGLNVLTQMQMLNSTGQAGSIAVVPAPTASQPASGTMVYQTPQGVVYATPNGSSNGLGGVGGSILFNIPQTPTVQLATPDQIPPASPQIINIPVPVSLAVAHPQMIPQFIASQIQQVQSASIKPCK